MKAPATLDELGFLLTIFMGTADWTAVSNTLGVHVIFDRAELIYVGMAGRNGKGSLRKRLRDHPTGQVVNMFALYMLLNRLLDPADLSRSSQEAEQPCRAYIREHCMARSLPSEDGSARAIELQRGQGLSRSRTQAFRLPSVSPAKSTARGAAACSSRRAGGSWLRAISEAWTRSSRSASGT